MPDNHLSLVTQTFGRSGIIDSVFVQEQVRAVPCTLLYFLGCPAKQFSSSSSPLRLRFRRSVLLRRVQSKIETGQAGAFFFLNSGGSNSGGSSNPPPLRALVWMLACASCITVPAMKDPMRCDSKSLDLLQIYLSIYSPSLVAEVQPCRPTRSAAGGSSSSSSLVIFRFLPSFLLPWLIGFDRPIEIPPLRTSK